MKKPVIFLLIGIFLTGVCAGFIIGQFVDFDDLSFRIGCEKKVALVLSTAKASDTGFSSEDLSVNINLANTYVAIFEDASIQNAVAEKFPGVDYSLSFEHTEDTNIFYIVARGPDEAPLADVCNFAADIFREKLSVFIPGVEIRIISNAVKTSG